MSLKWDIKSIFMNRVLTIKLALIALYFGVTLLFFRDELLMIGTKTIHHFGEIPFMVASISFGVILVAVLYNFALYINMRSRQYLYYSLAQLSALLFLINLDTLFISPFDKIFGLKSIVFFDLSQLFMLSFSVLFLEAFFQNYQVAIKGLVRGILFFVAIDILSVILFSHAFLIRFIPIFIPIFLVLSEGNRYVKQRDLPLYFLLMGWSMVILIVTFEYFGILELIGIAFPFLHIAIALESILLSLAIVYKFRLIEKEQQEQKMLMFQQSRLASMGEMMSSIVHQWRQPLNIISFGLMNIKKNSLENNKNIKTISKLNTQVQYMSQTIEDFRNFYNPSKVKEEFDVSLAVENSHKIATIILEKNGIDFNVEIKENFSLYGYQNELEQVILNIINNAKDAFIDFSVDNPMIKITIDSSLIYIDDNAGGIKKEHVANIFKAYFSTKENSDGIGLYISKMIIEKEFQGELLVESIEKGTRFIIKF